MKAGFYLLTLLFHVNSDIWAKRTLPLPVPGAVSHDYGWIHFLKPIIPLVYLAKPGNPVGNGTSQQLVRWVFFAIARTVGWVSQWLEQENTPTPIGRPRQVYAGAGERNYVNVDSR